MNVLLVTPMPPAPRATGAIPVLLHAQLVGLRARHHVTVLTLAGPRVAELEAVGALLSSGVDVHAVRRAEPRGRAVWERRARLAGRWLGSRWPRRSVWFFEPEMQRTIDRVATERSFDLIAVEDSAMGAYRYPSRTPVVLTEHEVRRHRKIDWAQVGDGGPRAVFGELDWQRWRRYQTGVWERFALVQVFTERDARALVELAPSMRGRVRVNPFGVEVPSELPDGEQDGDAVLFFGNFRHAPNRDAAMWLCRAVLPRLRQEVPTARLTLVGANAPADVRALAGDAVRVLDAVDDLAPLLARSAVVLAPLRIGGGMRMKVLYAMAFGKAVVTTPRGADGLEVCGQQPPLCLGESAAELAHATAGLLRDGDRRRTLGFRARAFVQEHHSAEAYARRLEHVYAELLQGRDRALAT